MCLALPGQLIEISPDEPMLRTGVVDFAGVRKSVSLAYLPDAKLGDYVVVHAGLAIGTVDEDEAKASLQAFSDWDQFQAAQ